jgi:hypothetical protein
MKLSVHHIQAVKKLMGGGLGGRGSYWLCHEIVMAD